MIINEEMRRFDNFVEEEMPVPQSRDTMRTYSGQARQFLVWCERNGMDYRRVGHPQILEHRNTLMAEGYGARSIGSRLRAVRFLYRMLQVKERRIDNPAEGVRGPVDTRDPEQRTAVLSRMEFERLISAPDQSKPTGKRDLAILMLLGMQGMRRMEVSRLQLKRLDLKKETICVIGKGGKRRTIPLVKSTMMAIEEWLRARPALAAREETAVFVATHGGGNGGPGHAMSRRSINRLVDGYLAELGLKRPGVSCHTLRRTYATLTIELGADWLYVARTLGHESLDTTLIYTHMIDPIGRNPARLLERIVR